MLTPLKTDDPHQLREYLRDVVALATLPTIWFGAQPLRVAESLAASLFTMLVPELVVVALTGDGDGRPIAIAQTGRYENDPNVAASLQETLFARARSYDPDDLFDLPNPRGSGTLRWAVRAIGHLAELGVLAVAFPDKRDFPTSYKLMMGIAATQAATAIQNGRFLRAVRNSEEQVREANRGLEVHLAELQRANAQREKAEQALREAQSRLEAALTAGEIGTFVWDVIADRMYGDRNFDVLFGIPVRADGTAPLADFVEAIPPDDRERTMGLVKQTMETGCDYRAEYRIITGGKVRWVIARGKVEKDASGKMLRFPGVLLDITERKRAEDARRDSEQRLRAVVEATPECVKIVSPEGKLLYMNPAGICMIEADSLGQVQDACVFDLIAPEHRPQWIERHRRVCGGERLVWEFEIIRMSGTRRWMETHAVPLPLPDGRNAQLGVTREITARKIAEVERERLLDRERAAREEAETLAEVGRLINGELDLQALVQKVTDATTRLTRAQFGSFFYNVTNEKGESYALYSLSGAPREKFASFPMPRNTKVFAPTFEGKGVIRLDDVTKDPRYGQNPPYHGMPKGHLPVRSYLAVPVTSRSGEVLGGLFFGHSQSDIFTERDESLVSGIAAQTAVAMDNARLFEAVKRANEMKDGLLASERAARSEAEQASRIKDDFLSTLSHELRTPLNAIIGWSQILQGPSADAEDIAEGVKTIERNAKAQAQIIEDLLDMSRIVSGKLRLDVQRVDLADVVRAAVETVRPAAEAKGIRIQAVLNPMGGPISGDPNRLQQIFWNLLTNAVKFTPKGGRVQVLLERVNSHVEVSIIDTGEGIAPQFLPHVFDRFRQADASTTRRHGGLGLGLSIVKQLVEMHGGSVRVKSAGLGTGSTFTVALPVLVLHPDPLRQEAEHLRRNHGEMLAPRAFACPELHGVRVVAVDDEPDARALVKRLLEERGAQVRVAASASEALDLMRIDRPDVLVSDIGMPGEDGYTLIRKVRALGREQGCAVPAVALTAYARAEDRMKALAAGFQMHVVKPVEPAELIMVVASLAGRVHS